MSDNPFAQIQSPVVSLLFVLLHQVYPVIALGLGAVDVRFLDVVAFVHG